MPGFPPQNSCDVCPACLLPSPSLTLCRPSHLEQSWSWWPSGLRHLLSGVIHGQDMYWGCGFESHWGHGWSVYPCRAITYCRFNQLYCCQSNNNKKNTIKKQQHTFKKTYALHAHVFLHRPSLLEQFWCEPCLPPPHIPSYLEQFWCVPYLPLQTFPSRTVMMCALHAPFPSRTVLMCALPAPYRPSHLEQFWCVPYLPPTDLPI